MRCELHCFFQVGKDEDLSMVLKNVVVPGGGYYQGFNPILDKLRQDERLRLMEQVVRHFWFISSSLDIRAKEVGGRGRVRRDPKTRCLDNGSSCRPL